MQQAGVFHGNRVAGRLTAVPRRLIELMDNLSLHFPVVDRAGSLVTAIHFLTPGKGDGKKNEYQNGESEPFHESFLSYRIRCVFVEYV